MLRSSRNAKMLSVMWFVKYSMILKSCLGRVLDSVFCGCSDWSQFPLSRSVEVAILVFTGYLLRFILLVSNLIT